MNLWTSMIRLDHRPYCPTCAIDLLPDTTLFVQGMAICYTCAQRLEPGHVEVIDKLLTFAASEGEVATASGLRFWVSRPYRKPRVSLCCGWIKSTADGVAKQLTAHAFRTLREASDHANTPETSR